MRNSFVNYIFSRVPPFSFLVGHELLKKALIYCAIDPGIGGLLIRGEKGTGKTTAVRSFSHVLPEKEVVSGCRFSCVSGGDMCVECASRGELSYERRSVEVVELPLNASEDRVVGSIDIEGALREGVKRFEMGVLGEANGNILYIDEANLLEDHIVDLLLDVSVSGVNRVRREGVSFDHPCRFILVGTMNPEEGELRPQFMDRFGLSVEVEGFSSSSMRQEVVERVFSFEAGRDVGEWKEEDDVIRSRIESARGNLSKVEIDGDNVSRVCEVTSDLGLYGMRGDIMLMRVARASSAYRGLNRLDSEGLRDGFALALPHRVKGGGRVREETLERMEEIMGSDLPLSPGGETADAIGLGEGKKEHTKIIYYSDIPGWSVPAGEESGYEAKGGSGRTGGKGGSGERYPLNHCGDPDCEFCHGYVDSKDFAPSDEFETMVFSAAKDRIFRKMSGKRSLVRSRRAPGRYVAARSERGGTVAMDATIRAAVMGAGGVGKVKVGPQHLMYKEYLRKAGNLVLFLLDGSSSIETQRKIGFLKSSVRAVLKDAYVRRDRVSIIVFRDRIAEVLLSPTSSVRKALMAVDGIRSGGTTPLSLGLYGAYKVMQMEKRRSPDHPIYLMVITDGKANISAFGGDPYLESLHMASKIRRLAITSALVDVTRLNVALEPLRRKLEMWENGMRSSEIFYSGRARMLAEELKGDYLSLGELARDVQISALSHRHRII